MAITRYVGLPIVVPDLPPDRQQRERLERPGIGSFSSYSPELFKDEPHTFYTLQKGDRLDVLARETLGDGRYWWIICIVNGILDPINDKKLIPGSVLRMVHDPKRIIDLIQINQK